MQTAALTYRPLRARNGLLPVLLPALLAGGILTHWVRERWAVTAFQLGAYALVLGWFAGGLGKPKPVFFHPLLVMVSAVPLWGLLQILAGQTVYAWDTWNGILNWLAYTAVVLLTLQVCAHRRQRERFLAGLLWFALALSIVAVVQVFTSPDKVFWIFPLDREVTRHPLLGPFIYHNRYAAFIELFLPLALWRALKEPGLWLTAAAVMVASAVAGGSRAGAVLLALELPVFLALAYRRRFLPGRAVVRAVAQVGVLLALFGIVVGADYLAGRLMGLNPLDDDRVSYVKSSLRMAADRPWMGFGLQTWSTAYPEYALVDSLSIANQAHCDWVQWAAEGGLPLLALLVGVAAMTGRFAWRSPWCLGPMMVFLHGLVDFQMQEAPAFAALVLSIAAAGASDNGEMRPSRRETEPVQGLTNHAVTANQPGT